MLINIVLKDENNYNCCTTNAGNKIKDIKTKTSMISKIDIGNQISNHEVKHHSYFGNTINYKTINEL